MSSTLLALRASSEAGMAEQKRLAEKKRNILVLIHHYLVESGYVESAERVQHEAGSVINKFEVADNVDLNLILGEYESYYEMRFDKKPKLVRKFKDDEPLKGSSKPPRQESVNGKKGSVKKDPTIPTTGSKLPVVSGASPPPAPEDDSSMSLGIQGTQVGQDKKKNDSASDHLEERVLKPPPQFGGDAEMRQLAAVISREIYQESPNVRFDDIIRLDEAKRLLSEAVQLPIRFPSLFIGILRPWKGILLHGPPGTGKTLLARAVATECNTTFFNISASTLVSKWRGDSEKLVRALFDLARHHAPSTIFLDEIDSILSARGGEGSEHEASRRMKTELLIQMDGVKGAKASEQVFVMAASNLPWDLDTAVLRRLEKRVLVPLPEVEAREAMLRKHLEIRAVPDLPFTEVAQKTAGFSGADIELLCREAAMMPVRRLMAKLTSLGPSSGSGSSSGASTGSSDGVGSSSSSSGGGGGGGGGVVGSSRNLRAQLQAPRADPSATEVDTLMRSDPVTAADLDAALQTTRPSSDGNAARYEQWQQDFGSV